MSRHACPPLILAGAAAFFAGSILHSQQVSSLNAPGGAIRTINSEVGFSSPADPHKASDMTPQPRTLSSMSAELQPVIRVLTNLLEQYRKSGNREGEASTLCALGTSYSSLGQKQKAIDQFQSALAIYHVSGDYKGIANSLSQIGGVYRDWGFPEMGIRFYRDALQAYGQTSDKLGRAIALNNLGVSYLVLANKKKAFDYLNQAREAYSDAGDHHAEALALINIGAAENFLAHDSQKSLALLQEAVTKLEGLNDPDREADAFELMGVVWAGLHKHDVAESNLQRALALYREAQNPKGEASVLKRLKSLHEVEVASTH